MKLPSNDLQLLNRALFEELIGRAKSSPRLRTNHNFHRSMDENPHRFLNVMVQGTYITPHRHLDPPKSEAFLVLEGEMAFFEFDDAGNILQIERLGREDGGAKGAGSLGIDIQPGVWHTLAVLSEYAICYEVKPGPYSVSNDKDFARWAPREGQPGGEEYLAALVARAKAE